MKIINSMIAWNVDGDVCVSEWPDRRGWSDKFERTSGACFLQWRTVSKHEREKLLFILFNTLVVRDGVSPDKAHKEFLKIEEYRKLIALDQEGAEE